MEILFEDSRIFAVYKPSGIPSQFHENSESAESAEEIMTQIREEKYGKESCFLLHRLDNGTSGVLLFAKNESIYRQMRDKFKAKKIQKFYTAWSGIRDLSLLPHPLPFEINTPLAHHPKSRKRMVALSNEKKISHRGQPLPAHTILFNAHETTWMRLPCTEFEIEITTGVMHQIRVHLKSLGFPLLGDRIYGAATGFGDDANLRLGLHAKRVEFDLEGKSYRIEAEFKAGV